MARTRSNRFRKNSKGGKKITKRRRGGRRSRSRVKRKGGKRKNRISRKGGRRKKTKKRSGGDCQCKNCNSVCYKNKKLMKRNCSLCGGCPEAPFSCSPKTTTTTAASKCPSNCSGHGKCNTSTGKCSCYLGFKGVACGECTIASAGVPGCRKDGTLKNGMHCVSPAKYPNCRTGAQGPGPAILPGGVGM